MAEKKMSLSEALEKLKVEIGTFEDEATVEHGMEGVNPMFTLTDKKNPAKWIKLVMSQAAVIELAEEIPSEF